MNLRNLATNVLGKSFIVLCVTASAAILFLLAPIANAQAQSAEQAQVWTQSSMGKRFAEMLGTAKAKGIAGSTLGRYDGHSVELSSRTASGQVEVHHHFVDVIFVSKGQATLLTGGTVLDRKEGADGEERGTSMRGGVKHTIAAGDLVDIPAGLPHQMLLQPGTLFEAEIVKVRVAK